MIKKLESEGTVHFVLGMVIGDNLGLNSILGFAKGFKYNIFCRFCLMPLSDINKSLYENLLRNCINYEQHIEQNDYKNNGILENSIFNSISNFHVTQNFCLDLMHNLEEGVIKYG